MTHVKKFSDFTIKNTMSASFVGDKIPMKKVLGKPVIVQDYKIEPSKFEEKGNGKRLVLQILLNNDQRIIFTGASLLMETIAQIPKEELPFSTTIIEENERFIFT